MIQIDSSDSSFDAGSVDHSTEQTSNQEAQGLHDRTVPANPRLYSIPIPSQQILATDDYKDIFKKREFQYTQGGSLILNSHNLKLLCLKQGLYQFPQLNTKLYLHFKCIEKIQGLNDYINIKTLYLENNVLRKIQNLECLPHLENLFLQNNMIEKIENLEHCKNLKILNLSANHIFKIEGLSELTQLQNLMMTNNYLKDFQSLEHLGQCSNTLTAVDFTNNQIVADQRLFDILPGIKCLYLSGNPLVREINHYRRTVIGKLKKLLYLDQRAVGEEQRLIAEKWIQQGNEGMKKVRDQIQKRRQQKKEQQRQELMKDINVHRKKKVNLFKNSKKQLQEQIDQLEKIKENEKDSAMRYYYDASISEKKIKIQELQDFIVNIECRIQGKQEPKKVENVVAVRDEDSGEIVEPENSLLANNPKQESLKTQVDHLFEQKMAKYKKQGYRFESKPEKNLEADEIEFPPEVSFLEKLTTNIPQPADPIPQLTTKQPEQTPKPPANSQKYDYNQLD